MYVLSFTTFERERENCTDEERVRERASNLPILPTWSSQCVRALVELTGNQSGEMALGMADILVRAWLVVHI